MAYTLAQLAKLETDPLRKAIIMNILRYTSIMEIIPWENVDSLKSIAVRWETLPTVAFRKINAGYTPNEGDTSQVWESVYGFGGEIKFDRVFNKVKNLITDPKVQQTQMKIKALALTFNDYFINGDQATDADGFEGLKKRIAGMPARQTVNFNGTGSSAALDPTASIANARQFITKWEQAFYRCNRGDVGGIFLNEGMYWGFASVLRYAMTNAGVGMMDITKDSFDREIPTYKGSPFIDVGLKRDQTTEIITDAETADDAGTDATSVYFTSFGPKVQDASGGPEHAPPDEGLTGIQLSDMEAYDPLNGGEQESTPTTLLRIDWWLGLANFGSFGLVRAHNLEGASNWT